MQTIVSVALGAVLLLAVGALLVKMYLDHRNGTGAGVDEKLRIKKLPDAGDRRDASASSSGITSVGSGTLVIILLLFLYPRLRGSQMVGTDLAQAIPMVGSAALAHIVFGDFKLGLTLSILIGSIPGVLIGASVSSYAPTAFLRGALAAVLLVSGLKLVNVPTLWRSGSCCWPAWWCSAPPGCTSGPAAAPSARSPARPQMLAGKHRDFGDEPALQTAGSLSEA